ncbi:MAG: band 7 protein, partial [Spirochaetia bacterium]|nr:band 7 protein [Spirochaetia bacterium]
MLGIRFIRTKPTEYVILHRRGKIKLQGAGLSFFYYAPSATVLIVPAGSQDTPFIFNETSVDFQELSIQGEITYRVKDPVRLASLLDFTVNPHGQYTGDGMEKLPVRLTNHLQVTMRERLSTMTLPDALKSAALLVSHVKERSLGSQTLEAMGVELIDYAILKISPTPEISRALEAEAREMILKSADSAVFERRNFAVEQERKIKENELQTQIAVEEKTRMIREEQMNAEISVQEKQKLVEEAKMKSAQSVEKMKSEIESEKVTAAVAIEDEKKKLVQLQNQNHVERARARGEAMRLELTALQSLPPDVLDALLNNQMDASKLVGRAFRDLAKNAQKIG